MYYRAVAVLLRYYRFKALSGTARVMGRRVSIHKPHDFFLLSFDKKNSPILGRMEGNRIGLWPAVEHSELVIIIIIIGLLWQCQFQHKRKKAVMHDMERIVCWFLNLNT